MTKNELITEIAKRSKITKVEAQKYYKGVINVIADLITEGNDISLPEVGKFKILKRSEKIIKEREMSNVKTGKKIIIPEQIIPAHNTINFKPSNKLKKIVKQLLI